MSFGKQQAPQGAMPVAPPAPPNPPMFGENAAKKKPSQGGQKFDASVIGSIPGPGGSAQTGLFGAMNQALMSRAKSLLGQ